MTKDLLPERHELLLKARSAHNRLGDSFYSIFRILPVHLEHGLLKTPLFGPLSELIEMSFVEGQDFGVGVINSHGQYASCSGIIYSAEDDCWKSMDGWTESLLSSAARDQYYATESLIERAKHASAHAQFEADFHAAYLEAIPSRVTEWARKQRKAAEELQFIRQSVRTLRARKLDRKLIQEALDHPSFSQELIRLLRSTKAA